MMLLAFPSRADNLESEEKAEIVLSVTKEDIIGNGTGYQMLLDGSHSTYGDIILPNLQILAGEYGDISPESMIYLITKYRKMPTEHCPHRMYCGVPGKAFLWNRVYMTSA